MCPSMCFLYRLAQKWTLLWETFEFLFVGSFKKICPLLHAKASLFLNCNSLLAPFIKGSMLFAGAGEDCRFRGSRSSPLWCNCSGCRSSSDSVQQGIGAYQTSVVTCMPKISQARNHWVWKNSGRKGLAQCYQCTPIFYRLCWKLWSHKKQFVSQHNFSLEFQIKRVCLAFLTTFKWKNWFLPSTPIPFAVSCPFSPFGRCVSFW